MNPLEPFFAAYLAMSRAFGDMSRAAAKARRQNGGFPDPVVSEAGNIRSLYLETDTVQSSMDLERPERLVLPYSHAMMGWLMFVDSFASVTHVGVGGASLIRFIRANFPQAKQLAIEFNPKVAAVAQQMFQLPEPDGRFELVLGDGAQIVRGMKDQTDVLLIDAFDGFDVAQGLTDDAFFESCRDALTDQGVFCANWWIGDPRMEDGAARVKAVFGGRSIRIDASRHGNMAVMAFKPGFDPEAFRLSNIKARAERLKARGVDLDYAWLLRSLVDRNAKSLEA